MSIDVFLSVGRTSTPEQERFVQGIEQLLRANGLTTRAVGRNSFSSKQPLVHVRELMQQCCGTVIIAFERIHITQGTESRGGKGKATIRDQSLPTVWNHIEAAMAYLHDHPLLVIAAKGLRGEGLIETGYDWYVQWVDLDPSTFGEKEFLGVLADWKSRVQKFCAQRQKKQADVAKPLDAGTLKLGEILKSLTVAQLWAFGGAILGLLAAVGIAAFKLGSLFAGN